MKAKFCVFGFFVYICKRKLNETLKTKIMKAFIYSFIASLPTLLLAITLLLFATKSIQLFYGFFFLILTIIIFVGLFMILKDEFKPNQKRGLEFEVTKEGYLKRKTA